MGNTKAIGMTKQEREIYARYQERMQAVEAAYKVIETSTSEYWWALYEIYRDGDWSAEFETLNDWIGDLSSRAFGPSRSKFFQQMDAIGKWKQLGFRNEKVRALLGEAKSALTQDLGQWFDRSGEIKPEVQERLNERGEDPKEVVARAATLSPGEARKEIRSFLPTNSIYVLPDSLDWKGGAIHFDVKWESSQTGVIGVWHVTMKLDKKQGSAGLSSTPNEVIEWVTGRLGIGGGA